MIKSNKQIMIIDKFLTNQTIKVATESDYKYIIRYNNKISFESYDFIRNNSNLHKFEQKQKDEIKFYSNYHTNKLNIFKTLLKRVDILQSIKNNTSLQYCDSFPGVLLKNEQLLKIEMKKIIEICLKENV